MTDIWFWGELEITSTCGILRGAGRYKCIFCDMQMSDRFDWFNVHVKKCKKKAENFEIASLTNILRLKGHCDMCYTLLDMSGTKKDRHMKTCKGMPENINLGRQDVAFQANIVTAEQFIDTK